MIRKFYEPLFAHVTITKPLHIIHNMRDFHDTSLSYVKGPWNKARQLNNIEYDHIF